MKKSNLQTFGHAHSFQVLLFFLFSAVSNRNDSITTMKYRIWNYAAIRVNKQTEAFSAGFITVISFASVAALHTMGSWPGAFPAALKDFLRRSTTRWLLSFSLWSVPSRPSQLGQDGWSRNKNIKSGLTRFPLINHLSASSSWSPSVSLWRSDPFCLLLTADFQLFVTQ